MTRQDHLLVRAEEEAAELIQRLSKALCFGLEQVQQDADDKPEENPLRLTNKQRIVQEYTDLVALMEMLDIEPWSQSERARKQAKVERYLLRSKREGRLDE